MLLTFRILVQCFTTHSVPHNCCIEAYCPDLGCCNAAHDSNFIFIYYLSQATWPTEVTNTKTKTAIQTNTINTNRQR